jgi:hypothetical protein
LKLQTAHFKLGHCGEDSTRATANYYGWNTTGRFKPCEDCGIGKSKQKALNKMLSEKSKVPGERWFIDISSIKHESIGGTKFWFGMLDDCTDLFISHSVKAKSHIGKKLVETLQKLWLNKISHPSTFVVMMLARIGKLKITVMQMDSKFNLNIHHQAHYREMGELRESLLLIMEESMHVTKVLAFWMMILSPEFRQNVQEVLLC